MLITLLLNDSKKPDDGPVTAKWWQLTMVFVNALVMVNRDWEQLPLPLAVKDVAVGEDPEQHIRQCNCVKGLFLTVHEVGVGEPQFVHVVRACVDGFVCVVKL